MEERQDAQVSDMTSEASRLDLSRESDPKQETVSEETLWHMEDQSFRDVRAEPESTCSDQCCMPALVSQLQNGHQRMPPNDGRKRRSVNF
mmetsp:Transcript_5045/g.10428  ORF Transcript_5045/g.10428 Transcript_5045/m.10428 type:complete len:90 (+) Transcript_5045:274-543(+)